VRLWGTFPHIRACSSSKLRLVNGHRRDDIASDYPTLSTEADVLAAEVSRLSMINEREAFAEEVARRAATSPRWGEWMQRTDRYLADFDPALVEDIRIYLAKARDELRARARVGPLRDLHLPGRGWDAPAE
jgi:hypothetical protein